jgi:uncharacterized protein YjbI with pentapeptide repeats
MQIDSVDFRGKLGKGIKWDENVFRYCTFEKLREEGAHVTSEFIDCKFEGCDWYWGLFNVATFVGVIFRNCDFRGASFSGCRFVECEFDTCNFTIDNFGGKCSFTGARWYACRQSNCRGLEGVFKDAPFQETHRK